MTNKLHYKVSYVIEGGGQTGPLIDKYAEPKIGEEVSFNGRVYQVTQETHLMPATKDDFGIVHATCRYLQDGK